MKLRFSNLLVLALFLGSYLMMGVAGCAGDPNVEGGKLNLQNKDYAKALENFEKAITTNPSNGEAWKFKAQALLEIAKAEKNPVLRAASYTKMAEAVGKVKTLLPAMAKEVGTYQLAAWATEINDGVNSFNSTQAGMLDKALAHFGNAVSVQPDSAYGHLLQARAFYKAQKFAEAAPAFENGIRIGTKEVDNYLLLCDIYLYRLQDRANDALRIAEAGMAKFPTNETLRAILTETYRKTGQGDRAITSYKEELARNPESYEANLHLGNLLLQMEKTDEAIPFLEKALSLKSTDQDAIFNMGLAYFNTAVALNKKMNESTDLKVIDQLKAQRNSLFGKGLPLLEQAKANLKSQNKDISRLCTSMFQGYAQLYGINDQRTKDAQACSGQ
jgi:tetratricopeptide (TPR) repeat protein